MTWHNLHFYQDLMSDMRGAISDGSFAEFESGFLENYFSAKK